MPGPISKTPSVCWMGDIFFVNHRFSKFRKYLVKLPSGHNRDTIYTEKQLNSFKGILHRLHHRKDCYVKEWLAGFGWVHISDGIVRRDAGCKLCRKTCPKPKNSLFILHQYTSSVTGLLSLTTSWHTQKAGHANCLLQPSQTRGDHIENLDRCT